MLSNKITIALAAGLVFLGIAYHLKSQELNDFKLQVQEERAKALEDSLALQKQIEDLRLQNEKDNEEANKTVNALRARIANGVHIPATNRAMRPDSRAENRENECRLSAEFADRLVSIAEKGDRAIRKLNQCIDSYNALRARSKND